MPYIDKHQPWLYMCSPSWTPLPPPSPSHPSGSSQCTSPEHPVPCINLGLAIYFTYDNIHVSMLFFFQLVFNWFPGGSDGKASAYSAGDLGSIPGWGRSLGEGNGNPLQYSCLKNPMDGGAWQATVHGVTKSRTRLNDFTFFLSLKVNHRKCLGKVENLPIN